MVEFGEKTVREAMKPRPEIVAVPTNTTVEQFIELLRDRPFSRVPVFEGTIHNIVGIVYAQDVLQVPDTEARTRTVDTLMRSDVYFVPESKLGSDLLREMQKNNIRMAIVVDEYGGVAGLVTIEDLVEEIVGEIRDEHEKAEVIRENDNSYIVPGNMDVDRLDELFGMRPEGKESATVAGLVSELAGRIPQKGEVIEEDGLRFEVLESTERRVERVRISASRAKADEADIVLVGGAMLAAAALNVPMAFHSGFVCILGRPNAGKSTLLNALVGEKLAIISPKPQTTRNRILGIIQVPKQKGRPGGQVILIDTPGVHRPTVLSDAR